MDLQDFHSNAFLSDYLSHQCDQIKLGKLKLVDPAERQLADKERMAHKQAILDKELRRAYKRNKAYSPLVGATQVPTFWLGT